MIKVFILIVLSMIGCCAGYSQTWLPMDYGFKQLSALTANKILRHPQTGEIFIAGFIQEDGRGNPIKGISRWLNDIQRWDTTMIYDNSWGTSVSCLQIYNEDVYGMGQLTEISINEDGGFHKLTESGWEYIPDGPRDHTLSSEVIGDKLYLAGSFELVGDQPSYGIAVYDGENFTPFFGSFAEQNHRLDDIEKFQDEIYVVGKNLDGFPVYDWRGLAKMGEDELVVAHEEFTGTFFQMWVYSLCTFQDKLYIGGLFHNELGFTGNGIQAFDGTDMYALGDGVNSTIYDMEVYENELYVAGAFYRIGEGVEWMSPNGGTPCGGVAKWNGSTWTCLIDELEPDGGSFRTIEIYNDTLYAGGNFGSLYGDTAMSMIAMLPLSTVPVGVDEPEKSNAFSVYPNPANENLYINFVQQLNVAARLELFNSMGQSVNEMQLSHGVSQSKIDISDLPSGLYTIQISTSDEVLTKKVVVGG